LSALAEVESLPATERFKLYAAELAERGRIEDEREALPQSLGDYIKAAWKTVEPGTTYVHGWHVDAISEHLEAVTHGQIRKLIITVPPRCQKSLTAAVFWPTWMWTHRPRHRFLYTSYALTLSIRDALKSRRVIQSPWYQARWGDVFSLTGDQNAKMRYDNNHGGYRLSSAVGGTATGEGGDTIVVDDAHNLKEIHSDVIRPSVIDWWDQVMYTRVNDPKVGSRVVIGQRGHEEDLTGHLVSQGGWEILSLPMEFELDRKRTSIGWADPRKTKGELLWPERFSKKEVDDLKVSLGEYGTASQLQQRPSPVEGGLFKRAYFRLWPADVKIPKIEFVIQSYDTAFTDKTSGDETACTVWGVFKHLKLKYNCVVLLDAWNEHLTYPELRKKVKLDLKAVYGEQETAQKVDLVLVEEKGSGITLLQDLRLLGVPAYGYDPHKADKVSRANAVIALAEAGRVYLMESAKRRGEPVSWCSEFMHQLLTFPNAARDDYVDTLTQALILMRNRQMLEAKVGKDEEEEPQEQQPYRNPYAQ
jgi:predicted phage terminase large subunit-like protein